MDQMFIRIPAAVLHEFLAPLYIPPPQTTFKVKLAPTYIMSTIQAIIIGVTLSNIIFVEGKLYWTKMLYVNHTHLD